MGASVFSEYSDKYQVSELTRTEDGILTVRFHKYGGTFRYDRVAHAEWGDMFDDIKRDPENRAVIITGTGDAFSPPRRMPFPPDWAYTANHWQHTWEQGRALILNILEIPVPVIGAINGPVHIHSEVPLLSDIVLCTPDTSFRDLPHFQEQMTPGDGMHVLMPLLMGRLRASYYLLTGQTIEAEEAKQLGMVNEIVARDGLMERAHELARDLLRQTPALLRYTRLLLNHELKRQLHGHLELGIALEGIAAWGTSWQEWPSPTTEEWPSVIQQPPE
jgi:enoyl-CoA hydratase/carnithine racemase